MNSSEQVKIRGYVRVLDENNKVLLESNNLIVNGGKNIIAYRLLNSAITINQIGVGNSNTAPATNQTDLLGSQKLWKTIIDSTNTSSSAILTTTFFQNEANFVWREVGLRASNNTMIARVVIVDLNKTNTQVITVEWTLTVV